MAGEVVSRISGSRGSKEPQLAGQRADWSSSWGDGLQRGGAAAGREASRKQQRLVGKTAKASAQMPEQARSLLPHVGGELIDVHLNPGSSLTKDNRREWGIRREQRGARKRNFWLWNSRTLPWLLLAPSGRRITLTLHYINTQFIRR